MKTIALSILLLPSLLLAQIYHPPSPRTMWDTWVYEEKGEYQLFFLQSDPGQIWNTIGRAVSRDLIHWQTLPPIESKGPPGAWDHEATLTGITVKEAGRYAMFYAAAEKNVQRIGVMFSADLKSWNKHPSNPILLARGPHYGGSDWRDLFTWKDARAGLWHACTCARTADGRSAISHLTSKDLLDWEYLPPLYVDAGFSDMEVPEYFTMGSRHYLLMSNVRSRKDLSGRKNAAGTYYFTGDSADGPYRMTPDSLLLGSGNGRFDVYVGRTLLHGNTRLLYSQTVGGTVSWSTPKVIRQNGDGSLWLAYWPQLAKLETRELLKTNQVAAGKLPITIGDAMITVRVDLDRSASASLGWLPGAAVTLDAAAGKVSILQPGAPTDEILVSGLGTRPHQLRLFLRARRAEVYLDDRWLFNTLVKAPATPGFVELSGKARFRQFRVAELEPLDPPAAQPAR